MLLGENLLFERAAVAVRRRQPHQHCNLEFVSAVGAADHLPQWHYVDGFSPLSLPVKAPRHQLLY